MHILFSSTLYPSTRLSHCIFFYTLYYANKLQTTRENMGKNIKSYATIQVHFPQEREGGLMAKIPNLSFEIWYGLTVHIRFWIYKPNFSKLCLSVKFTVNYAKFAQFTPTYPAPFINALCFRYLPRQEILSNSSKLCRFRAIHPHSLQIT